MRSALLSRPLRIAILALASVIYAVLFGEVFLRLFAPQPLMPRYVTGSAEGIRANIRNARFGQSTPETHVRIAYNDAGMRDDRPAPPLAKRPGECRVALLGDSYFVGFESNWAESYAMQLERALAAAGRPCRVLNFAVSGFGQQEMLVALNQRVLQYHPDLVVMSWHYSDPFDNLRARLFALQPDGNLSATGATYLPGVATSDKLMRSPVYRWLTEHSHLYSAVRERLAMFVKSLLASMGSKAVNDPDNGGEPQPEPENDKPSRPVIARPGNPALDIALVGAIQTDAKAAGAEFLMVDIPVPKGRTGGFVSQTQTMLPPQMLAAVPNVTPIPEFALAAGPAIKLYWERGQKHWTPLGNRLAAEATVRSIGRYGLLRLGADSDPAGKTAVGTAQH